MIMIQKQLRPMGKISRNEFNDIVRRKVEERMEVPSGYDFTKENGLLFEDYALDSLDVMELILEFEDIYHIKVDDRKIKNVKNVENLLSLLGVE